MLASVNTATLAREITDLSRLSLAEDVEPAVYFAVEAALGNDPQAEAGRAAPASRMTEAMMVLLHAWFVWSREPSTAAHDRILDGIRDLEHCRLLGDVQGSC